MTSQTELLELHDDMIFSCEQFNAQFAIVQRDKRIIWSLVGVCVFLSLMTRIGITSLVTPLVIMLLVLPVALISTTSGKNRLKALWSERLEDGEKYVAGVKGFLSNHGYTDIISRSTPEDNPFFCFASKDEKVYTVATMVYPDGVKFTLEEEAEVWSPPPIDTRTNE